MNPPKEIILYDSTKRNDVDRRPDDVVDLIQWLTDKLEEVPSEYHDLVTIEFCADNDYSIEERIYYFRPATDAEMEAQKKANEKHEENKLFFERQQYEKLKAKFDS